MQALKLNAALVGFVKVVNGNHSLCVVRRKLRINCAISGFTEQVMRTCQIRYVGVGLARKYGIAPQAVDLAKFDFSIPICTFYQAYWNFITAFAC